MVGVVNAVGSAPPDTFPVAATASAPPVEANAKLGLLDTIILSVKSGKLKVVEPSPAPYVSEITANKAA
jgi:hypothetical protein